MSALQEWADGQSETQKLFESPGWVEIDLGDVKAPPYLPELDFQPFGAWVPLLVAPPPQRSDIIHIERAYDMPYDLGVGWVLGVAQDYLGLPPVDPFMSEEEREKRRVHDANDTTWVYKHEVKRGHCVLFRRFLKTQGMKQAPIMLRRSEGLEDFECFFIHVGDIIGLTSI